MGLNNEATIARRRQLGVKPGYTDPDGRCCGIATGLTPCPIVRPSHSDPGHEERLAGYAALIESGLRIFERGVLPPQERRRIDDIMARVENERAA